MEPVVPAADAVVGILPGAAWPRARERMVVVGMAVEGGRADGDPEVERVFGDRQRGAGAGIEAAAAAVGGVEVGGELAFGSLGDVVHDAGEGVAPELGVLRSLDDLHAFEVHESRVDHRLALQIDAVEKDGGVLDAGGGEGLPHAADDRRRRESCGGEVLVDEPGGLLGDVLQIPEVARFDVFGRERRDRQGHFLQRVLALAGGDDDLLDHVVSAFVLGGRGRRQPGEEHSRCQDAQRGTPGPKAPRRWLGRFASTNPTACGAAGCGTALPAVQEYGQQSMSLHVSPNFVSSPNPIRLASVRRLGSNSAGFAASNPAAIRLAVRRRARETIPRAASFTFSHGIMPPRRAEARAVPDRPTDGRGGFPSRQRP